MKEIRAFLETVKIARKQSHRNLTVFPLLAPGNGEPDYLTLQEAIGQGLVEVREAGRSGVVLELLLINRGRRKTLVVEGEELVGAKQDRTVNASFLIPDSRGYPDQSSRELRGAWPLEPPQLRVHDQRPGDARFENFSFEKQLRLNMDR
ncbi:MAG: hypothetical protein KKA60_06640 [Proteobacteria bacterium]|nr:hypothetical protein [Pseudomonadota bacterium]